VFKKLKKHNLKFHSGKYQIFHIQVEYVGHMIYPCGLGVQKAKVEAISQVPQLTNISWLQTLWSLNNYYHMFIKGFNNITKPLTQFD